MDVKLTLENADITDAYIGESKQTVIDGCFELTLPASKFGTKTTVALRDTSGVAPDNEYEFIVYSAGHEGMPDKVTDYLSVASQYTNGGNAINRYVGINAVSTLLGVADEEHYGIARSTNLYLHTSPYSLGSFGGYITYYYEEAIKDDPKNPYGVDFIVLGNSVDGTDAFAEPANVLVSEDGVEFYSLAGALHYDDGTNWNYSRTYVNNDGSAGEGDGLTYGYPLPDRYPLFQWTEENKQSITFTGVTFSDGIPAFGYGDVGEPGRFDNTAFNPYIAPTPTFGGRIKFQNTDGMDLAWAVDANGMPVTFENGIHYIKLQNSSGAVKGVLGETSAEIHTVLVAKPSENEVGKSTAPTSIKVNGTDIYETGQYIYEDISIPASGAFVVSVETSEEDANVYINSFPEESHTFASAPTHGIIRIIVQNDDKEPQIYYLTLKPDENIEGLKSSTITFVAGGVGSAGTVNGQDSVEITYTDSSAEKIFPIPVYEGREFLGWYDADGNKYESYLDTMPAALTLTAKWEYILDESESSTIGVTFRLIGATKSQVIGPDGKANDDIDLGDTYGYKGSEYVNWIKTKSYTMNKGDTMYDLFVKALADAGLAHKGADRNYVTSITAPLSLGGYELSEMTNGQRSGWMYTVGKTDAKEDQKHPSRGLLQYDLQDGDVVIWHYVNDYAYEVEDWFDDSEYPSQATDDTFYSRWLEAPDVTPTVDNAPKTGDNQPIGAVTLTPKATAINGTAAASVSGSDMSSAISDAKKNNSTAIIIEPAISGTAKKVSVELPKVSVSSIGSDTDADLKIETPVGNVTIPNDVLASVVSQANGDAISIMVESVEVKTLTAEQQELVGNGAVFDISIMSGDKPISSFGGKSITISLPYTLKAGETAEGVTVWYLSDDGKLELMACTYDKATGLATFATSHLSNYVVGYDAWQNPFTDVKTGDWFYDAVRYAVEKELFNGTSETTFAPNADMTRAMLVTVLHRLEGRPAVTGTNSFSDVKSGEWYTDAVIWATANGIVGGYGNDLFGTDDPITREQMATMLLRYAAYKKYDTAKANDLAGFTDSISIASYALDAMKWANAEGLITGRTATTLAPTGTATRAEVATILMRFAENMVK